MKKVFGVLFVLALVSGLLTGYVLGVIGGAVDILKANFNLSDDQISILTGAILSGCILSSIIAGPLNDYVGRKKAGIITTIIYIVGTLIFIFSKDYNILYAGRFIQGLGFGMAVIVFPSYLSEMSPGNKRGVIVTSFQVALTAGIFFSSIVNLLFQTSGNWQGMFWVVFFIALILLIVVFFADESHRWLVAKGDFKRARKIMEVYLSPDKVQEEFDAVVKSFGEDANRRSFDIRLFKQRRYWLPLLIIMAAVSLNQLSGYNVFIQNSTTLIRNSGLSSRLASVAGPVSVTLIKFVATILTMIFIDRIGRRKILMIGTTGMFLSLICVAFAFYFIADPILLGYISLVGIILIVGFFAFGPGGVVLLICSELLPTKIRGLGLSLSFTFGAIVGTFFVSSFISLGQFIGYGSLYLAMSLFALGYFFIGKYAIPETKGIRLEDIENEFSE